MTARLLLLALLLAAPALAAPADLDALLRAHVRDGRVDYAGLARDREALDRHVAALAEAPTGDRVFWLNAYNALVLVSVLDGGSPEHPESFFRGRRFRVAGEERTLDEVERMATPDGDPRLHFALVCASRGCPPLLERAWTSEDLEQALEQRTRDFIRDPSRVRLDPDTRTLWVSPLFQWHEADFAKSAGSVPAFVARYLPEEQRLLLQEGDWTLATLPWDWRLNGRE